VPADGRFRVGVFLDYSNVLRCAERAFGYSYDLLRESLAPTRIGRHAAQRCYGTHRDDVELAFVEVHLGVDDPQAPDVVEVVARWAEDGDETLPCVRRRGKWEIGVDMACALSCVHAVLDDPPRCEAAVLFSSDLDLRPATEVIGREGPPSAIKTVSWYVDDLYMHAMPRDAEHGACDNVRLDRAVLEACLRENALQ
jgi:hypothetical protein